VSSAKVGRPFARWPHEFYFVFKIQEKIPKKISQKNSDKHFPKFFLQKFPEKNFTNDSTQPPPSSQNIYIN